MYFGPAMRTFVLFLKKRHFIQIASTYIGSA